MLEMLEINSGSTEASKFVHVCFSCFLFESAWFGLLDVHYLLFSTS